jgi:hypothetical protein
VLAFSFAPLALGILAWLIWPWLLLALAGASAALLVLGLREVEGWSTTRAVAAVALAVLWLGTLGVCLVSLLVLLGR